MRIIAILNRDGGTLKTMDLDAFSTSARAIFAGHGHDLECEAVSGRQVEQRLRAAAAAPGIDAIMAGGGDGTMSTAAGIAFETGVPLAILPAGTMNLFARALQIPLALPEALEALAAGSIGPVDIATANGRPFVHQFGVGIHARLVKIREGMNYSSRWGKIIASTRAVIAAAIRPPRFEAELRSAAGLERRDVSGIAVSNNPLGEGHIPHADEVTTGLLGVYIAAPMSTTDLLKLAAGLMAGSWRDSPMVSENEVAEVILHFPRRKRGASAVIDGELTRLDKTVQIRMHPGGLKVLLPRTNPLEENNQN